VTPTATRLPSCRSLARSTRSHIRVGGEAELAGGEPGVLPEGVAPDDPKQVQPSGLSQSAIALGLLVIGKEGWTRTLRGMLLVAFVAGACGANTPVVPLGLSDDPVPLPDDLTALTAEGMSDVGGRLERAVASTPRLAADAAVEIAKQRFLDDLHGSRVVVEQDTTPDAVIRRHYVNAVKSATDVWMVVYRWKAGGDDCPDPCDEASFVFVDDRSGEVVENFTMAY